MKHYVQILIMCILSICLIGGVAAAGTEGATAPENGSMTVAPGLDVEPTETEASLDEDLPAAAEETVAAPPNPASTIIFGSATVEAGEPAVIPVSVANIDEIEGIGVWVFYGQGAGTVKSVNLTGPLAGANLTYMADHPGHLQFAITTTAPFTVGAAPVQIAEIHFDTYRETPGNYSLYPEATYSTEFNESHFEHVTEGWLNTTPPPLPDLVGYLDPAPPQYVKKYSNGTIYMNPTFVIGNIGGAGVTDEIVTQVTFVGESEEYKITDDIAAGANYTIFTDITIDPNYSGTEVVEVKETGSVTLIITAGAEISPGTKQISIDINPDRTIEEIRYDNNFIEAQTTVTYTDLRPVLDITLVSGLSSSNTTIQEDVVPGTYRVTYGVENRAPGVDSEPTWLRVSKNGVNETYDVPALRPGDNWTMTETINLDRYAGSVTYTVEANAAGPNGDEPKERIKNPDSGTVSKTIEKEYASFKPVTVIFPRLNVTSNVISLVPIELSNISSDAPVVSFSIPVTYDPSVARYDGYEGAQSGVSVRSTGYGRLLVEGSGLSLSADTEVVNLRFIAQSDSGRVSEIGSTTAAYVKTNNNRYLELDITKGALVQDSLTDARVYIWAPTASAVGSNVTFTVYVNNPKATPVNVSANVTLGGTVIWSQDEVALGAYQSRYFTVDTWKPVTADTYTLAAGIAGDDVQDGNTASTQVRIEPYDLNITTDNRQNWERWYGYNVTAVQDQYFWLGTYFTANQPGYVNASLSIWYANGTAVDLSKDTPFDLYYYYPAEMSIYSYSSSRNSVGWYYIRPRELGTYNYSINLESRGEQTHVNGTIVVREQNVDIKVLNSTILDNEANGEILFDVFNREPFEGREVVITAAAGAEGRTLEGLDYLIGYPHGCPEQTMSPALAVLRVKQYYESRGQLNDERNDTYQAKMQQAYNQMKAPDGYNAQQLPIYTNYGDQSGGWAWGQNSAPSMFYTLYPNYVFSELRQDMDNDPTYWGFDLTNESEINLTASTVWLLNKQGTNGGWSDWGYICNSYEWTGFISEKFVGEFGYLTPEGQRMVNESLNRSFDYLVRGDYTSQSATPVAYAVFGIDAIRDHYADNATLDAQADAKLGELQNRLLELRQGDAANGYHWGSSWAYEDTANAVLALNRTGLPAENETVRGGIRYLVSVYDTNGRWGNTRGTAAVIEALTQVQIPSTVNFNVQIGVEDSSGAVIRAPQTYTFNSTNPRVSFNLNGSEIAALYGSTPGANLTGKVTITGKSDTATDAAELVVAVQSRQKVPKSVAFATIPDEFIDPIATDLFLDVTVPAPEDGIVVNETTVDVAFTVNNTGDDRTMLILEIPTRDGVAFDGGKMAADMAYYMDGGRRVYISHMYNATAKTLYVYPGSDDESKPSVVRGEVKNFYVPLNFTKAGEVTVEARIYPMYDDENMALGDATASVKGYGNLTLSVVDENLAPLEADFYIDGVPVASGTSNITREVLEGDHNVSIMHTPGTVNTTLYVRTGESTEYSAQIATDPTIPHISMVVGDAGDFRVMPPVIEDTISEDSTNYWSAVTPAKKTFNSTITSSGGTATISVEVPTITRAIGTAYANDTVAYSYHNTSGWQGPFDASGYISGGVLSVPDVDTGSIDQIVVEFIGRALGDVNGGGVTAGDARDIAWYLVDEITFTYNDRFYADVGDDGSVSSGDARDVAWYLVGDIDTHYQ